MRLTLDQQSLGGATWRFNRQDLIKMSWIPQTNTKQGIHPELIQLYYRPLHQNPSIIAHFPQIHASVKESTCVGIISDPWHSILPSCSLSLWCMTLITSSSVMLTSSGSLPVPVEWHSGLLQWLMGMPEADNNRGKNKVIRGKIFEHQFAVSWNWEEMGMSGEWWVRSAGERNANQPHLSPHQTLWCMLHLLFLDKTKWN